MLFAYCLMCLIQWQGIAQENRPAYYIGYFAPFGLNQGGTFGASFKLKTINKGHNATENKHRSILFAPSIGYFYQPNTAQYGADH